MFTSDPIIRHTGKIAVNTSEGFEERIFYIHAKISKYVHRSDEWMGAVQETLDYFKHKENGETILVLRRDKALQIFTSHYEGKRRCQDTKSYCR